MWDALRPANLHAESIEDLALNNSRSGFRVSLGYSLVASVALSVGTLAPQLSGIVLWSGSPPDLYRAVNQLPPLLILHGGRDPIIPVRNLEQLDRLCTLNHFKCILSIHPEEAHAFSADAIAPARLRLAASEKVTSLPLGRGARKPVRLALIPHKEGKSRPDSHGCCSQGLRRDKPSPVKWLMLRVTSVRSCSRAVAASSPSITGNCLPRSLASADRNPQRSAMGVVTLKTRSENQPRRTESSQAWRLIRFALGGSKPMPLQISPSVRVLTKTFCFPACCRNSATRGSGLG